MMSDNSNFQEPVIMDNTPYLAQQSFGSNERCIQDLLFPVDMNTKPVEYNTGKVAIDVMKSIYLLAYFRHAESLGSFKEFDGFRLHYTI
jgi:hypothetical protein